MAWHLTGQMQELCSCKMWCPCWLGPEGEPDQGWCSGAFVHDIREGESDGVSLAGTKVVWAFDSPGNFFHGNATCRLYIDEAASPDQRRQLEAIFTGKKGGVWEAVNAAITKWVPTQITKIDIQWGDNPFTTVGSVAQVKLQPLKDPAGRPTVVRGAAGEAACQFESMNLARSDGSRWSDPEMRRWEGSSGAIIPFNWSA